jgi:siroheme synthase-like protein
MSELFPIFLKLRGRAALVVGGGAMAALRVKQLMNAGALVTVIAPAVCVEMESVAKARSINLIRREFGPADLGKGYFIVVGATNDPAVQRSVAEGAERCGILYNIVDAPERCNFFTPAVVERGDLTVAICSEGQSPVLSGRLRRILDEALPKEAGEWTALLGELRERLKEVFPGDLEKRRALINEFIQKQTKL